MNYDSNFICVVYKNLLLRIGVLKHVTLMSKQHYCQLVSFYEEFIMELNQPFLPTSFVVYFEWYVIASGIAPPKSFWKTKRNFWLIIV